MQSLARGNIINNVMTEEPKPSGSARHAFSMLLHTLAAMNKRGNILFPRNDNGEKLFNMRFPCSRLCETDLMPF